MLIDPRNLMTTMSLEELNETADYYFRTIEDPTALLQKPFSNLEGSTEEVLTFLLVLKGLGLPPGSTLLDFGAGTCWTSILAAGFGYRVIAADVSPTALDMGRRLLAERPPLVPHEKPRFTVFDGRRLDLPDASVDGILCISAFHHVPNQEDILHEFARVLTPNGRAGFNEPGPVHSRSPQAQDEMRNFNVLENDIIMSEIRDTALACGFRHLEVALFFPEAIYNSLEAFDAFMSGSPSVQFDARLRSHMTNRRMFFLEKGEPNDVVSMTGQGLDSTLDVALDVKGKVAPGGTVPVRVRTCNTGRTIWRPSRWPLGPVRLGARASSVDGGSETDFVRLQLPDMPAPGIKPGDKIEFRATIEAPQQAGVLRLEFQLLAENVAWFGQKSTSLLDVGQAGRGAARQG